jgi:vacuolar-type H+-ATPase subunit F/Vma7
MSGVVAIGEADRVAGYALAGAEVRTAEEPGAVAKAWQLLDDDTELVILTRAAADALAAELAEQDHRIWAVLPE